MSVSGIKIEPLATSVSLRRIPSVLRWRMAARWLCPWSGFQLSATRPMQQRQIGG